MRISQSKKNAASGLGPDAADFLHSVENKCEAVDQTQETGSILIANMSKTIV